MRPADAYRLKYRSGDSASQTIEPSNYVDSLPDELLARILSPVELKSLVQARAVCKSWRASVEGKAVSDLRANTTEPLMHLAQRMYNIDLSARQGFRNEESDTLFSIDGLDPRFRRFGERLAEQSDRGAAAVVYV